MIKICDFGSAKVLDEDGLNTPYIVSRYYRAPELILACSDYTNKIDIWGKSLCLKMSYSNRMHIRRTADVATPVPREDRRQSVDRVGSCLRFAES